MIAADLTVPEALVVLLGRELHPVLVTAGVLVELELRGAIRCSDPGTQHFGKEVRTSRFRLEILDTTTTGDDLLDATLAKARSLVQQGTNIVGADAMNRRLQSVRLRQGYIDRLTANGRLGVPPTSKGFLGRRRNVATPVENGQALQQRLSGALLGSEALAPEPAVRAVIALVAVSEGFDTVGRPLWALLAKDPRAGASAREREQTRLRVLERVRALVGESAVAQAVALTLTDRAAGMDTRG